MYMEKRWGLKDVWSGPWCSDLGDMKKPILVPEQFLIHSVTE